MPLWCRWIFVTLHCSKWKQNISESESCTDKDGVYLDIRGEGETFVGVMLNADKAEQLIQMLVRGIEEHNALVR